MKTEHQYCFPEQAIALHKCGIMQQSMFYYIPFDEGKSINFYYNLPIDDGEIYKWHLGIKTKMGFICINEQGQVDIFTPTIYFSAFSVAELGVMLPETIPGGFKLLINKPDNSIIYGHCQYKIRYVDYIFKGQTEIGTKDIYKEIYASHTSLEAWARAATLIDFLERDLITAEQVNQQLLAV